MNDDKFIFCLEAVSDIDDAATTETLTTLEQLAVGQGISSIYKTCDTIEGLEESLGNLLYDDHNFKGYEIIYLVMSGEANNIRINDYNYSMQEISEIFEGKMKGKILHFSNAKRLDLTNDEAQYFLDVTGARALSGYGSIYDKITGSSLDKAFFSLFNDNDDLAEVVEELFQKHYALCKLLDFRVYC